MSRVIRTLAAAAILLTTSLSGVQAACASAHVAATLTDFAPEARSSPFYWGLEGSGSGQITFVLRAMGDDCTPAAITISYATKDGAGPHNPATAPADYAPTSGQRAVATDPTHGGNDRQPVSVPLVGDVIPEAVLESATIELTGVQGGGHLSPPTSAALHIVDDDGPTARVSLDPNATYRQPETYNLAGIAVFRGGSDAGTVTVPYRVEPGPAPSATPGADYRAESGTLTFAPGDRVKMVPITLVNDRETEGDERFTVTLTGAEGGLIDGASSSTFTILDNEELGAPESIFHHPRHKKTYRAKDYKIREIHVFTTDRGGSGVTAAEVALRKNLSRGGCEWWVGKKWKRGSCSKLTWRGTGKYETDFFYLRFPSLPKSRGRIESYTAFSRAIDGAGNKERQLDPGRNANTFEIR